MKSLSCQFLIVRRRLSLNFFVEQKNIVKDNIRNSNNTTTQSSSTPKFKSKKRALSSECENPFAKYSKNTTKSTSVPKSKLKKCTVSQQCSSSCVTEIINDNYNVTTEISSPTKQDKTYEHKKKTLSTFLINKILFEKMILNQFNIILLSKKNIK